jgi:hypothetical protein
LIVNIGLPEIGTATGHAALADLSWILNAYAIVFAALLVPAGRLADGFGNRRAVILGLAVFALASLGAGLGGELWQIVAMRCLQAVGAAILVPSTLGHILVAVAPPKRARAVRLWAISGSFGAAAGPALGGLLVALSWRWVFFFSVPVCVVALLGVLAVAPRDRGSPGEGLPDLLGGGLLVLALSALVLTLVQGDGWGWGSPHVIGGLAVIALAGLGFVRRSLRDPIPIVDFSLFADRRFTWSNASYVIFALAFNAQLLALTLWLQDTWSWSALQAGFGLAPVPVLVSVVGLGLRRPLEGLPDGPVAATGGLLLAIGGLLIAQSLDSGSDYVAQILPGWLLVGVGVGLAIPTFVGAATRDLPGGRTATGSAVVQMSRQLGSAIGVAFLVAVLGSVADAGVGDFALAWRLSALVALIAALLAVRISTGRR